MNVTPASGFSTLRAVPLWAVMFLVTAIVQVVVWWQYRHDPFAATYVSDALSYHHWAARWAENGLGAEPVFHQSPLLPLLLSILYRLLPETAHASAAIGLQVLVLSIALACLVPLGRLCFGRTSDGVSAAVLALLYGPFVFYALKLLPVSLALATQAAGLLTLMLARTRPHLAWAALAGLVWGAACLARAEMLIFVPVGLLALFLGQAGAPRRPARLGVYLAGVLLAILPATLHNVRQGDRVLIASAAGENFFLGNQRGAEGGHKAIHDQAGNIFNQRVLVVREAERARGRELRPSEVSAYWRERAVTEIAEDPGAWIALELRKLGRMLHPGDPTDIYSYALERRLYLQTLYALPVTPWVLFLLAGVGATLALRRTPRGAWPVAALVGVHALLLLAFFVEARLRMPLLFALCPLAGHAVAEGLHRWRSGSGGRVVPVLAALTFVALAHGTLATDYDARDAVRLAAVLSMQQRLDESLLVLEPFVDGPDMDALALDQAGWVLQKRGDFERASERYLAVLESNLPPNRIRQVRTRLAQVLESLGRLAEAREQHDLAVESGYANAGTLYERALFRLRHEDRAGAVEDLRRSVSLDPSWMAPREALRRLGASND